MIAFEVRLNGEKICVAGIGNHGVLSQTLSWCPREPKADSDEASQARKPSFYIGGLVNEEHIDWIRYQDVEIGDEFTIVIVEVESADEPTHRERAESDEERTKKVRDGLDAAKALLPSPLIEGDFLASLRGYDELLAADEPEMSVKVLANLGDLNGCDIEFWGELSSVASDLQMYMQLEGYYEKAEIDRE